MTNIERCQELRKAIQLFAGTLTNESDIMSVATVFPPYEIGKAYKIKDIFSYGTSEVGDPQLYQVLQDHTSAEQWKPDEAVSLYKKIGITEDGTPEWVQPLGATDAYDMGDIVVHNGKKWKCTAANNVWEPGVYGWEEVVE